MKRLLLAVAFVSALATAAQATQGRVAVVYTSGIKGSDISDSTLEDQFKRNLWMLRDVLDNLGVDYFFMPGKHAKVEQLRLGVIARGSQVDTVAGVIHANFIGNISWTASGSNSGYRGDSLSRVSRGGVEVPHLFLTDNSMPLSFLLGSNAAYWSDASGAAANRCSTGVVGDKTIPQDGQSFFWYDDPTRVLQPAAYTSGWVLNPTPPAGGIRPILGVSASGHSIMRYHGSNVADKNYNAQWPDSLPFRVDSDTVVVWERLWNIATLPNAKPMVFCDWFGAGAIEDSVANAVSGGKPICEGNIQPLLVALARFDSLCGGIIKRPADGAITVQGAVSRGLRRWNRGIAPGDTAVFYSSLDSLDAWGVPVTFYGNVNPDSATAYARDIIKLKEVSRARFAPQVWDGVADTTKGGLLAVSGRYGNPRDIFGKNTKRAVYGDGSATGADSSQWAQLRIAKHLADSLYGSSRVSASLRAPLDDWDKTGATMAEIDSTLWILPQTGFTTIVVDGRASRRGSPGGSWKRERSYASRLGGEPVKILAHHGGMLSGGQWQQTPWDSSSVLAPLVGISVTEQDLDRAFAVLFNNGSHRNFDLWPYDDQRAVGWRSYMNVRNEEEDFFPATFPRRGHIINLSCASLSGDPANPARSGLWVIKGLWQTSEITRLMAWGGRPLLRLTYPEDVEL